MSASNNTYLIDIHKKCVISGCGTSYSGVPDSLIGVPYTAYGNLSEESLKTVGMGFVEGFKPAVEQARKDFEKFMKPITTILNAMIGKIPVMQSSGLQADQGGMRDTMIKAVALFGGFMELPGLQPNGSIADWIQTNLDKVYVYNPPMRVSPPQISVQGSSKITINFQYGACNVYDAYWEVYYPLEHLRNTLFPSIGKADANGTYTYGNSELGASAPYQQQIFVEMLKTLFKTTVGDSEGVTRDGRESAKYGDTLAALAAAQKDFEQNTLGAKNKMDKALLKVSTKKMNDNDWTDANSLKDWNKNAAKINAMTTKAMEKFPNQSLKPYNTATGDGEELNASEAEAKDFSKRTESIKDLATQQMNIAYDKAVTGVNEDPSKLDAEGDIRNDPSKSDFVFKKKEEPKEDEKTGSEEKKDLTWVIRNIVNWEPNLIGTTLQNIYKNYSLKHAHSIYMSYPNIYTTSLSDYFNRKKEGTGAFISLDEILLKAVDIKMDYSNVDERGFPMSGTLTISDMWPLAWPISTLNFHASGTSTGYTKDNIAYPEN